MLFGFHCFKIHAAHVGDQKSTSTQWWGGAVVVTGRRRWSCLQRRRPEAVAVRTTTRINRSIEDESGQERWGKALIVPAHVFF
jgi:hypothetical protein